jgi:hypothetical protein
LRRLPPTAASPAPPASRPPRARRRRPDRSPRSRRRPDRHGPKPPTPGSIAVLRHSAITVAPRRRLRPGEPPHARTVRHLLRGPAELGRPSAAHTGHAPRGCRPRWHCASGPSAVSAQWHPVKFYYFLIYSIHCKFKNLCRIHLNSENYETNFVGKVLIRSIV